MQLGLSWPTDGPVDDWAAEHRPQWTKTGFSPDKTATNYGDAARWAGFIHAAVPDCNGIVDLRTTNVQGFLEHPARAAAGGGIYDWFVDWVGGVVEETAGAIKYWEIWGEAACPYVGEGFAETDAHQVHEGMCYVDLLERCCARIKSVDPEAKVLLGGHGCDMFLKFYKQVMGAGGGCFFDVNNLHSFVLKWRTWETIEPMLRGGFEEMAHEVLYSTWLCKKEGSDFSGRREHPLCLTEFGWPTTPGLADWTPEVLGSDVLDQVLSVSEDQAADWTERCFRIFEEEGVQFVVWAGFEEVGLGSHWGKHLGIMRADGTPKGRLYDVFLEWLEKGRETEVNL